jgi:hypothetical protein
MAPSKQRSVTPAGPAHVSRRQAVQARGQLTAGGLPHQQQRRLRAVLRAREAETQRRRRRLRRLSIAVAGGVAALAIAALSFGLIPAINAARGEGIAGTFVVGHQVCSARSGCQWVGTFQASQGTMITGVAYGGSLPAGDGQGSVIPARYPGGSDQVYAPHGSHTWVIDLLATLAIGAAVAAALWISPLGTGSRSTRGART